MCNGHGTFAFGDNFASDRTPFRVAVADLNGAGRLDVIALNPNANSVTIVLAKKKP